MVKAPLPLDPYLYSSYLGRVVDGDTVLLHIDQGFGTWALGSKWPGGPDAKYPQGRYRLNGINTPERKESGYREALDRVAELAQTSETPGVLLVKTTKKRGKYRFLIDLYVKQALPESDPFHSLDVEAEQKSWISEEELARLVATLGGGGQARSMATEILWSRRALCGFSTLVHVNQTLLDEGLAKPYSGGKK